MQLVEAAVKALSRGRRPRSPPVLHDMEPDELLQFVTDPNTLRRGRIARRRRAAALKRRAAERVMFRAHVVNNMFLNADEIPEEGIPAELVQFDPAGAWLDEQRRPIDYAGGLLPLEEFNPPPHI